MNLSARRPASAVECRSRAIARWCETPNQASSRPNAATAAPSATGISQPPPATRMASDNGAAARGAADPTRTATRSHRQGDAQRQQGWRVGSTAGRVADLPPQRGDAGLAGERREKQQAGRRLQHPPDVCIYTDIRSRRVRSARARRRPRHGQTTNYRRRSAG